MPMFPLNLMRYWICTRDGPGSAVPMRAAYPFNEDDNEDAYTGTAL
jgi:hypothetical protein